MGTLPDHGQLSKHFSAALALPAMHAMPPKISRDAQCLCFSAEYLLVHCCMIDKAGQSAAPVDALLLVLLHLWMRCYWCCCTCGCAATGAVAPVDALLLVLLQPAACLQNIQRRGALAMRKSCVAVAHDVLSRSLTPEPAPPH